MKTALVVVPASELAARAAALLALESRRAVERRGVFRLALSGGRTPRPLYRLLAGAYRHTVAWKRTQVYWCDERCVPDGDPRSNFGLIRRLLLNKVPVPAGNIHPLRDAAEYERLLRGQKELFDLVVLGIGEDGHTASIFPGSAAAKERRKWVLASGRDGGTPRLTLTPPALSRSRHALFLVGGRHKRHVVRRVLSSGPSAEIPANLIKAERRTFIIDTAAAPKGLFRFPG